jgi:hypothetical protein
MTKDVLWLHQAFKMAVNEMDSNVNIGYPKELIDIVLNKAVLKWLSTIVTQLEQSSAIIEKLSSLVIRTPVASTATAANSFQTPLTSLITLEDSYEYRLDGLSHPYYMFLSAIAVMNKGTCTKQGMVRMEQHDDIVIVLRDNNRKPSFRYGEVVGELGRDSKSYTDTDANTVSKSIVLHTESGTTLENMYLTYLKVPNQLCIGGYNDLNGVALTRVELDIPQEYYPDIIEFAKMEVANTYGFTNKSK